MRAGTLHTPAVLVGLVALLVIVGGVGATLRLSVDTREVVVGSRTTDGTVSLGGIEIDRVEVAAEPARAGGTAVHRWKLRNPTHRTVQVVAKPPEVLEGCCPGQVRVRGEVARPGAALPVAPGETVAIELPLRVRADTGEGQHVQLPLQVGEVRVALHVRDEDGAPT